MLRDRARAVHGLRLFHVFNAPFLRYFEQVNVTGQLRLAWRSHVNGGEKDARSG